MRIAIPQYLVQQSRRLSAGIYQHLTCSLVGVASRSHANRLSKHRLTCPTSDVSGISGQINVIVYRSGVYIGALMVCFLLLRPWTVPITAQEVLPTSVLPSPIATSTPRPPEPTATPLPNRCNERSILQNSGFEEPLDNSVEWILGNAPIPPVLSNEEYFEGTRSLLLGNPPRANTQNMVTYSSVRQLIFLPANASTATVTWHHRSYSQESPAPNPSRLQDHQELVLLERSLGTRRILYRKRENTAAWKMETIDLTPFLGNTLYLYFNVFNDGDGNRTWMYLDDVQVIVCYPFTPPVVYTAAPTNTAPIPTPVPTRGAEVSTRESPAAPVSGTLLAVGVTTPSVRMQNISRPSTHTPEVTRPSVWQRIRRIPQTAQGQIFLSLLLIILIAIGYLRFRDSRRSLP